MIKLYSNIRQLLQLLILIFLFSSLSTLAQDSKLSENNLVSKSKLETNDFEYGLTIINHGAQFFGFTPFDWMIEMAEAIRTRAGQARILQYNKSTGVFEELLGYDLGGETILIYDWVSESDNFASGFSEAAADALFSALILGEQNGDFFLENIHFIGHSRGCSVNSETVERLLKIGIAVDHVTNLDAHDWGDDLFNFSDDYDVNPDTLIITEPASRIPNRGIVAWEGIGWSDSYWQTTGFAGRLVYGTYSLQLDDIGHSEVHEWYLGTIDNVSGNNSWYGEPYPERNESGFNYSRIGGLSRPSESGERQGLIFKFDNDGIVNGNFERGPNSSFTQYPGWSEHGGGGDGRVENNRLVLDQDDDSREHNRFFIPEYSQNITFFYKVTNAESGTPPQTDKFQLSIKNISTGSNYVILYEEFTTTELEKVMEVDITDYSNSVATISLELIEGGGNGINSKVEIDDIFLLIDPRIRIDVTIFLEGVFQNGKMNTELTQIPLNHPYNVAPWNYSGSENVSAIPSNTVDWVLLELRDKNNNTIILEQRAAFLLDNGKIVDLDGFSPVAFTLSEDEYFVSVKHRNHLSVMSANAIPITLP